MPCACSSSRSTEPRPARSSSISNFKRRLPPAAALGLAIFFLLQAALLQWPGFWRFCRLNGGAAGIGGYLRVESELRLMPSDGARRIFLIGSSITREDLDAGRLNAELGPRRWSFFNFGFDSAQPADLYAFKDRLFAAKPDVIVYLPHCNSFYGDYDASKLKYWFSPGLLPPLIRHLGMRSVLAQRSELVRGFVGRLSFLYRYNAQLIGYFEEAVFAWKASVISGQPPAPEKIEPFSYREDEPPSYYAGAIERCRKEGFAVDKYTALNQDLFTRFAREASARGIKLLVLDAPTHPLLTHCFTPEYRSQYEDFLRRAAVETGYVYLPAHSQPSFPPSHFIDFFHLNARGRNVLTGFLEKSLFSNGLRPD